MKQLTCEMCGSNDLIKQDGVFVCQSCGCKYSVEEAKKMMVEGIVKIDSSEKLINLYELARRAKSNGVIAQAQKYYEQIALEEPSDWESNFYTVYYQWLNCKNGEIPIVVNQMENALPTIMSLIENNVKEPDKKMDAIRQVATCTIELLIALNKTAVTNKNLLTFNCEKIGVTCYNLLYTLGNSIDDTYGELYKEISLLCWTGGISIEHSVIYGYIIDTNERKQHRDNIESYAEKIRKYTPEYKAPEVFIRGESKGCYVATCVYGSYDCPQVWALRRYRDDTLASTWYGRAFIRTYYAISPTIVKWFGDTQWFKTIWKNKLDKMVSNLRIRGVEDTPYQDKDWR